MSTGHMVEVKLNTTYVGVGGQASIGPQHPILYYVHKRPHCDDFLRRVSIMPCDPGMLVRHDSSDSNPPPSPNIGLQMVQSGGVHSFGTGVR